MIQLAYSVWTEGNHPPKPTFFTLILSLLGN
jgi:hypothetical protein